MQLIAARKATNGLSLFYWEPGSCATVTGGGWIGWTTAEESSHPSQSETEFIHKCLHDPHSYEIEANSKGVTITKNKEVIFERKIDG